MNERKLITKKDFLILLILLILLAALVFIPRFLSRNSACVAVVNVNSKEELRIDLKNHRDEIITLSNGMKLSVKNGKIAVIESDCKDKLCENFGYISTPGQVIACVPNATIVSIVGSDKDIDALSY